MLNWYALYTKPHKERQVQALLTARGIHSYLPLAPRSSHGSHAQAFFPCYLFAHADLQFVGAWTVQYTPGMRNIVTFGTNPAPIREDVISALQERLAHVTAIDEEGHILEPGDRVRISSGPLQDLDAIFDRHLSAAGRARVLVHLLKRWTAVELDTGTLKKAPALPRREFAAIRAT
ncbi:MAG: hypothetical protein M1132_05075 [Chloroflexi bacterium]|nr:hypothetical protein [Chloroflexota bacterium]